MGSGPIELHLLDTHVWLWVVCGGKSELRKPAASAIERAATRSALVISAISVWEVAMLESKGRIQLQMECLEWVDAAIRRAGLRIIPLSTEIAVASTRLPGEPHGDPADRIIAATARHENAVLLTRDRSLLDYAARGFLRAVEA